MPNPIMIYNAPSSALFGAQPWTVRVAKAFDEEIISASPSVAMAEATVFELTSTPAGRRGQYLSDWGLDSPLFASWSSDKYLVSLSSPSEAERIQHQGFVAGILLGIAGGALIACIGALFKHSKGLPQV